MQPYFLPYIGYFQLINAVDEFVVYDNIEFSRKGWINRNRILVNGVDTYFTIPLKKDSDFLNVNQRFLSDSWAVDRKKILNRISGSYRKAPFYDQTFSLVEDCFSINSRNLFDFIFYSIMKVAATLLIKTPIVVSSTISFDNNLKGQDKVLAICKAQRANFYLNPIGGLELYDQESFLKNGVELHFLRARPDPYPHFSTEFIPFLSIIDVMMFNSRERVNMMLTNFTLE